MDSEEEEHPDDEYILPVTAVFNRNVEADVGIIRDAI